MRCRTCDYALWNLKPGPCPECGTPFRPSDFRFVPNAVEFRCPGCAQAYFGTRENGQLEPPVFDCPSCGTHVEMDAMAIVPAAGVTEEETGMSPLPWEVRRPGHVFRAWWTTVIRVLTAPRDAMQGVAATAPLGSPLLFALVSSLLSMAIIVAVVLVIVVALAIFSREGVASAVRILLVQLAILAANVLFSLVALLVAGFVGHVTLVALRGARGGLNRTLQATLYASGATYALYLIPCPCSSVAAVPWWCVCVVGMLCVAHSTTVPRALIATLVALVVSVGAALGLATIPDYFGLGKNSWITINTGGGTLFGGEDTVADALVKAHGTAGPWPTTPLDLVLAGDVSGEDLARMLAFDRRDKWSVGGAERTALRDEDTESVAMQAALVARAISGSTAPFRLGGAIFCYRDVPDVSRDAWLIVVEPRRTAAGDARSNVWVVHTPGGTVRYTTDEFVEALAAENAERVASGAVAIPPFDTLPDAVTGVVPEPIPMTSADEADSSGQSDAASTVVPPVAPTTGGGT